METILVLEDDEGLSRGMAFALKKEGYAVETLSSVRRAKSRLKEPPVPDLLVLDLNLKDGDGLSLCREIREEGSRLLVIMVTARDMESDEVLGLEMGADDYITKPFTLSVLKARVAALFRRRLPVTAEKTLTSGPFLLNTDAMKALLYEKELALSGTEYRLLKYFIENRGRVLLKEQLLAAIWDTDENFVDENTLPVNIRRLRMKIERDPSTPVYLKTVHGMGYLWDIS